MISVTQVLQEAGLYDFSKVPDYIMQASQKFGTATHKACELWDLNNLAIETVSAPLIPRLNAWAKFRDDYKIHDFLAIEQELISKRWGFCGHPDRIYQVNKTHVDIYDIKTAEQPSPVTALQLGGYEILAEENYKLKVRNRWSVLLGEGDYKIVPCKEKSDSHIFLCYLQGILWRRRNLK